MRGEEGLWRQYVWYGAVLVALGGMLSTGLGVIIKESQTWYREAGKAIVREYDLNSNGRVDGGEIAALLSDADQPFDGLSKDATLDVKVCKTTLFRDCEYGLHETRSGYELVVNSQQADALRR